MADFTGTYKFESDDGKFDEFLKAMGVGMITRKLAASAKPTIEISVKDDGTYVVKTVTTFKTSTLEFKLNEEFDEKRMDDKTVKTTVTVEGNKLIQKQKCENPVTIVREVKDGKLITTCSCNGVECVRTYTKA